MRNHLTAAALAAFLYLAQPSAATEPSLTSQAFGIESSVTNTFKASKNLESMVQQASQLISKRSLPVEIFQSIHNIIQENGYETSARGTILSEGLARTKMLDCSDRTIIYLAVAEQLNLPIVAMKAPNHIFVAWKSQNYTLHWETRTGRLVNEQYYIQYYKIDPISVKKGVYLAPMTNQQVLAVVRLEVGVRLQERGYRQKALEYYNRAIDEDPQLVEAYVNRATIFENTNLDLARNELFKALDLDPNHWRAHSNLGWV